MLTDTLNLFKENNKLITKHDENLELEYEELVSHQAKYLCIITSGYLETSLKGIGESYKKNGGISGCAKYLDRMRNPKWCNILSYLVNIDPNLISALNYKVSNKEEVISNINSLSISRNNIAHGKSVNISIAEMEDIIKSVEKLIKDIEEIVGHHLHEIEQ